MRTAVCLLVPAWLAAGALLGPPAPVVAQPDPPAHPYAVGPMPGEPSAALSCASASCHGGGRPGEKGSEFSTWATDLTRTPPASGDPHAKAFRVLFNADSVRIAKLLGGPPAHQNALCLKCHAVPGAAPEVAGEGVSCAGCHGPDEKWLTVHYLPGWKLMSNREQAAYGFVPTKNLVARASTCAGCHVGDSSREVDHDLIAAGHPRLNFEYTRFHYSPGYRKHWADPEPTAAFEVRAWAVGQLASLRSALDLLHARAVAAQKEVNPHPWPEFTEGSCFACHQNVARNLFSTEPEGWPRSFKSGRGGTPERPLGSIPWQPWYTSVATSPVVGEVLGVSGAPDLTALRTEMEKRRPDPRKVADLAARARDALDARLAAIQDAEDRGTLPPVRSGEAAAIAAALAGGALTADDRLRDYDWDFVAQRYLGLAMAFHASGGDFGPSARWRRPLDQLKKVLTDQSGRVGRYDSPATYHPADAVPPLRDIRGSMNSRSGR